MRDTVDTRKERQSNHLGLQRARTQLLLVVIVQRTMLSWIYPRWDIWEAAGEQLIGSTTQNCISWDYRLLAHFNFITISLSVRGLHKHNYLLHDMYCTRTLLHLPTLFTLCGVGRNETAKQLATLVPFGSHAEYMCVWKEWHSPHTKNTRNKNQFPLSICDY